MLFIAGNDGDDQAFISFGDKHDSRISRTGPGRYGMARHCIMEWRGAVWRGVAGHGIGVVCVAGWK